MIISLHITHASAGIEAIQEMFASFAEDMDAHLNALTDVEYVTVRTCNRLEVYAITDDPTTVRNSFESFIKRPTRNPLKDGVSFILQGTESIRHLFRVCCGLDSMIVGEDQIQGQIRDAYRSAKNNGRAGNELSRLFDKALSVGKRVRTETALNSGVVSIGSAAVELAEKRLGDLSGRTVTIIGAGDMATVIARSLSNKGLTATFVSSRTYEHAKELANDINGAAVRSEHTVDVIAESDLVLVATSAPHVIIHRETIESAMSGRSSKMMIIDLSVPRNTDPAIGSMENVELETMDGLHAIAKENMERRISEIHKAESIIDEMVELIDEESKERMADHLISKLNNKVANIREQELTKAKCRMGSSDIDEVFDDFSRVLISRIFAPTYDKLKEASRNGDRDMCDTITNLFGLEADE